MQVWLASDAFALFLSWSRLRFRAPLRILNAERDDRSQQAHRGTDGKRLVHAGRERGFHRRHDARQQVRRIGRERIRNRLHPSRGYQITEDRPNIGIERADGAE
jgi:hypothetical protein